MVLKIYNTLTRKKENFKPVKGKNVRMYVCGPTVYWYQHIGNLRSYIFADVLRRVLRWNGFSVKEVMNVTDVGHLTSDADTGEDKIEAAARKEGKKAGDIANYYWKVFREDFEKLNIDEPDVWCKATEHIKEQIELVKKLEKKGFTYKTKDGIYFDTSKVEDYGKLARLKVSGLKAGKRITMKEKKHPTDFALWKFSEKPGLRQQEWKSPWGLGFPGWHVECSAMSSKYLGEQFDIHTGGIDHIPVHHTNEIAQSEAAFGKKPWVRWWMHGAFLTSKGKKVSKSKGGLFTISELEEKGFMPLAYRYFVFSAHYRSPLSFDLDGLENAQGSYRRLKRLIGDLKDDKKVNKKYVEKFEDAINNDLDMPKALAVLWALVRDKKASGKIGAIRKMDSVLGLDLLKKQEVSIPKNIKDVAEARQRARERKDWTTADRLREELADKGWVVEDVDGGYELRES